VRKDEARGIAASIANLPELLGKECHDAPQKMMTITDVRNGTNQAPSLSARSFKSLAMISTETFGVDGLPGAKFIRPRDR
jgi:hypothetical protein